MTDVMTLLLSVSVRAVPVIAIGIAAAALARRRSAALRHAIWCAVLVAVALLPLAGAWGPSWHLPRPATPAITQAATPASGVVASPMTLVESRVSRVDLAAPIAVAWLAVAIFLLARLAFAHARLGGVARRARPLESEDVFVAEVAMPIVAGLWRPRVLVPPAYSSWPEERRRQVVLHEMAHVRRGDLAWLLFARVVTAILWFHPLVRLAASRLRAEAERASDDSVLAAGTTPSCYAETLLELASRLAARRHAAGIPLLRRERLAERIESIVASNRRRAPLGRRAFALLGLGAILLAGLVASPTLGDGVSRIVPALVQQEPRCPVLVTKATVRSTPVGRLVRLDTVRLELENQSDLTIAGVRLRLTTRGASTDRFWCAVAVAPRSRATLLVPAWKWSNTVTAEQARHFVVEVTETRGPGEDFEHESPAPTPPPTPEAPDSPSAAPTPEAAEPVEPANPVPSERISAEVLDQPDSPIQIVEAWTLRALPSANEVERKFDRGHALTRAPAMTLVNRSSRTVAGVRLRFKADTESHAVTGVTGPIAPGESLRVPLGRSMWGRPEAMTVQILGVRFEDGGVWGTLDSTIDTRQGWIR